MDTTISIEDLRQELVKLTKDYATLVAKRKRVRDSNLASVLDRHLEQVDIRMEQVTTLIGAVAIDA